MQWYPAPAVEPMVEVPPSATTILVIEDDREQRIGMQMMLEAGAIVWSSPAVRKRP
jgi:hypothetical protein